MDTECGVVARPQIRLRGGEEITMSEQGIGRSPENVCRLTSRVRLAVRAALVADANDVEVQRGPTRSGTQLSAASRMVRGRHPRVQ